MIDVATAVKYNCGNALFKCSLSESVTNLASSLLVGADALKVLFVSVSASTYEKDFEGLGSNKEAARKVGAALAERALAKGISTVVFDRGGYIYHGRVSELAEGAREGGLKF